MRNPFIDLSDAQRLAGFESRDEYQARDCELEEQAVIIILLEISDELLQLSLSKENAKEEKKTVPVRRVHPVVDWPHSTLQA